MTTMMQTGDRDLWRLEVPMDQVLISAGQLLVTLGGALVRVASPPHGQQPGPCGRLIIPNLRAVAGAELVIVCTCCGLGVPVWAAGLRHVGGDLRSQPRCVPCRHRRGPGGLSRTCAAGLSCAVPPTVRSGEERQVVRS